jgi:hypothetical protein
VRARHQQHRPPVGGAEREERLGPVEHLEDRLGPVAVRDPLHHEHLARDRIARGQAQPDGHRRAGQEETGVAAVHWGGHRARHWTLAGGRLPQAITSFIPAVMGPPPCLGGPIAAASVDAAVRSS